MKTKYKDFKEVLDFTLNWTEKLKEDIKHLPYSENDIRKGYFSYCYTNVYHYYISYINILTSQSILDQNIIFKDQIEEFKDHFTRLCELSTENRLLKGHFNTINQRVFISSWSIFEHCISLFYEAIVTDIELKRQYNNVYTEVLKCIDIKEHKEDKLKKLLIKKSLHSIPIVRKYNYLFKKVKGYGRDKKDDQAFLTFYGKLRNTIHSNFIYYGNDYEYRFGDNHFVFENGKQVVWKDIFDDLSIPSVKLYIHMVGRLNQITKELFNCIEYEGEITDTIHKYM